MTHPWRRYFGSVAPIVVLACVTLTTSAPAIAQEGTTARVEKLKRRFECVDVRDAGAFVCSMKDGIGGSLVRKRLEPVITSSGTLSLRSVYRDRDWIYHDHVIVRIGDTELRTQALASTSPNVSRREIRRTSSLGDRRRNRRDDDYIAEHLSFRGADGLAIIEAIARAGDESVHMQLAGGPRTFEKTLSDDEKRLFAEAVELAALLRGTP